MSRIKYLFKVLCATIQWIGYYQIKLSGIFHVRFDFFYPRLYFIVSRSTTYSPTLPKFLKIVRSNKNSED